MPDPDLDTLLDIKPPDVEPDDFDQFWTGLYERSREVRPAPELRQIASAVPDVDMFEVRFTSVGDVRIGGWVALPLRPADGRVEHAVVVSHGYGGREAPLLDGLPDGAAAIFPVARGLPTMSRLPGIPDTSSEHVLHGIESADSYVHGGCAADVWCAASALLELLPTTPDQLSYIGGSFGGGIGALALPWDERFAAGVLRVPSFGQHDLRLQTPCTGSGEAVRQYVAQHPEAREVLRYFDAATAATRLHIPMLLAPALDDPAVPPHGQFAVCNAIPEPKSQYVFSAGHQAYPEEAAEYAGFLRELRAFLSR